MSYVVFVAVILLISYFAIGAIVFTRQKFRPRFGLSKDAFEIYKDPSSLLNAEEAVQKFPKSKENRAELICAYQVSAHLNPNQREVIHAKAREHVLWFIENDPLYPARWMEWGIFFLFTGNEEFRELWNEVLQKNGRSYFLLTNASEFCSTTGIRKNDFAEEIANRFPLDPQCFYLMGAFLERVDRRRLEYCERYLSTRWETKDYRVLEKAKSKLGSFFYPRWWARVLLRCRARNTFRPFATWYGYAIDDALNLEEVDFAKKFVPLLKERMHDELFGNNTILIGAHAALARLALHERNEETLAEEIKALIQIEKMTCDTGHWNFYVMKLLTELMTNEYSTEAKTLVANLKDAFPNERFIPQMEAVLNGEM